MGTYVKKGDRIKGEQIQCEARKISNPIPIPKSGRHKAQQIIIKNNAECEIKKRIRVIGKDPINEKKLLKAYFVLYQTFTL